jgi:hypothetical protein
VRNVRCADCWLFGTHRAVCFEILLPCAVVLQAEAVQLLICCMLLSSQCAAAAHKLVLTFCFIIICLPADVLGMAHVAAAAAGTLPSAAASCDQSPTTLQQQQQSPPGAGASCGAADAAARAALAAFTAAERAGLASLPELWFNRGAVALHIGDIALALQVRAQLDGWQLAMFYVAFACMCACAGCCAAPR